MFFPGLFDCLFKVIANITLKPCALPKVIAPAHAGCATVAAAYSYHFGPTQKW